ncbi:MAG: hypothetical protein ACJ74H_06540 [Thermoanaerobaculia bacterium]
MRILPVLLLLLVAHQALADLPAPLIVVEPPDPTSTTRITLIVSEMGSCPSPPVVTRTGFTITVALGEDGCLSPPTLITHRLDIGMLPPGTYTVQVTDGGSVVDTAAFSVLDANLTVRVLPSLGSIEGGTIVEIFTNINHCAGNPQVCTAPAISFGGIPATNVTMVGDAHYRATTRPHAAGPVEARVVSPSFTQSSFAFRYYDPADAPLPEFFERILIPVIYNGPGAHGSIWATEVSMRNNNPHRVEPWRGHALFDSIASGTPLRLDASVSAPTGTFLIVPREAAAALKFNALIRDVSREQLGFGTEIPVVRESDFSLEAIELLNVPLSPAFRRMLRIYSLSSVPQLVLVKVYSMDTGHPIDQKFVTLVSEGPYRPSVAVLDLEQTFPRLDVSGRVGITIDRHVGPPAWAFVSVTNNETQQVTVISPQ